MENHTYHFGDFSMSPGDRRLFRQGESVVLSPKAFDALDALVRHHGNLVSRREIFSVLWPGVPRGIPSVLGRFTVVWPLIVHN